MVCLGSNNYRFDATDFRRHLVGNKEVEVMGTSANILTPTPLSTITVIIGVAILLSISVILGIISRRKLAKESFDEFLVGKRNIGHVVTGCALVAAYISGWAYCGSTGIVYSVGFSGMWFAGIWSLLGIVPCCWLAAVKTREFSVKLGATTITESIGRRFESKGLQTIVALSMLYFLFVYSVGQLKAAGGVWYAITGFSPFWCLLFSIFIVWLYMALGGYVGTQWSMAFQGAFLGIVGGIFGVWAIIKAGGFGAISTALFNVEPELIQLMRTDLPTVGPTQLFSSLVGILATPVIFFTMAVGFPHNISRFLGMSELNKKGFWILISVVFLLAGLPIMLDASSNGLISRMVFGTELLKIKPWGADLAAPYLANWVGGTPLLTLYVMGLFAAALSTLSAMVFIMSANVTRDILKLWKPQISDKILLRLGYLLMALFLFLPFYWTLYNPPPLLSIFMGLAAMGLGAIFFFVTVVSYYWKRATKWGAIACVLYGTAISIYGGYKVLYLKEMGMGTLEWLLIGGCGLLYFGISLLTKPPSQTLLAKLFPAK